MDGENGASAVSDVSAQGGPGKYRVKRGKVPWGHKAPGRKSDHKRGLGLRIRNLPLRGFFLLVIFAVFGGVALLSGLTIWVCTAFRHYLLPDPNAVYLTVQETRSDGTVTEATTWLDFGEAARLPQIWEEVEGENTEAEEAPGDRDTPQKLASGDVVDVVYSVRKIEKSFDTLTPKRKLAYQFCAAAMVAVPALLSVCGILFAGFFFYKKRLEKPLAILSEATARIADRNLDFSIEYLSGDEMGALCGSFERMRLELARNNKAMWRLLDQRKLMQASVAHDLRNPIAIIQGYAEYLEMHVPAGDLSREKTAHIAANLKAAAMRLEQYTESVRVLNRLEDMEPDRRETGAEALMEEVRDDLKVMADRAGIALHMNKPGRKPLAGCLMVDRTMFFRILENVFENAARFAGSMVSVEFEREGGGLTVTVADDGDGFPEEILKKQSKALLPARQEDGHLGMGLAISRVLCEKHGGSLRLGNRVPRGAVVKIFLAV